MLVSFRHYSLFQLPLDLTSLAVFGLTLAVISIPTQAKNQLEEVMVTAQKTQEAVLETPVAISVFNQKQLQELRVTDIAAIAPYVPNLFITPTLGGSVNAAMNIRGAATTVNNLSRDASVGLYLDGVPISKTSGAIFDLIDLQQIEVLRGPQGTLYGKNTIGGAINLITAKPTGELGVKVNVGIGNYNLQELRTSIDLPALEMKDSRLLAKLAYFQRQREGTVKNPNPSSDDYDNKDQRGGRVDLSWQYQDDLTIDYAYDTFTLDQQPTAIQAISWQPVTMDYILEKRLGLADKIPLVAEAYEQNTSVERLDDLANDSSLRSTSDIDGHNLQVNYRVADVGVLGDIALKSITAVREVEMQSHSDFDGIDLDIMRFINNNHFKQQSQEFQLVGENASINYVVGVFYSTADWDTYNPRWNFQFGEDHFDTDNRYGEESSVAAFGQMTWRPYAFNRRLALTMGLRWTKDTKKVERLRQDTRKFVADTRADEACVCLRDANGVPLTINGMTAVGTESAQQLIALEAEDSWSKVTPVLIAAYEYHKDMHVYGKVSTGFKSGGFNGVATSNSGFLKAYDPETLTAYELGFKNQWLHRRLQTQVAIFYNDYADFQATYKVESLGLAVENAGAAVMSGLELEVFALLNENWKMAFSYAYLNSEYKAFMWNGVDVKDERVFSYSPENSSSLGFIYDPDSIASMRIDYSWVDHHWVDIEEKFEIESYGLLSAHFNLSFTDSVSKDDEIVLSLWGKNLTDEEYTIAGIDLSFAQYATFGEPRTIGLAFMYSYH